MKKKSVRAGDETRHRIVEAALETLRREGFAGATSRAIARAGGFNQALIFYHFGSLDALLLAALDHTSAERLERYRAAVEDAETVEELLAVAARAHAEDRETGHTTVVAQMIAGSVARPELAPELTARMEPWVELCEQALAKGFERLGVATPPPLRELAYAVATFYLGVSLLTHLDERRRIDSLFGGVEALASIVSPLAKQLAPTLASALRDGARTGSQPER
jgi:AcrR family transcriptional regulator